MIDGVLILNKPKGVSSGVFVRKLKTLFSKKRKIGHAGTLDPLATGLMIICTGKKTKEINQYQAERIKNLPIWCFHNKGDEIVPPSSTEVMIKTINSIGGKAKLTIYDIDDHNAYITYKNKELFEWFNSID